MPVEDQPNLEQPDAELSGDQGTTRRVEKPAEEKPAPESQEQGKGKGAEAEPSGDESILGGKAKPTEKVEPKPWMKQLPPALLKDPKALASLAAFKGPGELASAYLEMQGKGAVDIQTVLAAAEDADKSKLWKLLGRPDKASDYKLESKLPKELRGSDDTMVQGFRDFAFKHGMSQDTAAELFSWYEGEANRLGEAIRGETRAAMQETLRQMKVKYRDEYPKKMQSVDKLMQLTAPPGLQEWFSKTGHGNNPLIVQWAINMAELISEDSLVGRSEDKPPERTPGRFQYADMEGVKES